MDVIEFTLWQPNVAMENPPSDCFYGKIPQMVDAFFKIYHNMLFRTHSNLLKAHRLPTTTVRKLGRKGCSAEYRQPYFLITRMAWEAFSAKPAQLASHYHCVLHAHSVALCRIRVGVGGISNFQSLCQPRPRKIFHMKSSTGHESDTNPSNMAGHSWYEWLGMMQRRRTEPRSIKSRR